MKGMKSAQSEGQQAIQDYNCTVGSYMQTNCYDTSLLVLPSQLPSASHPPAKHWTVGDTYGAVSISVFLFLPGTLPESFAVTRALANG